MNSASNCVLVIIENVSGDAKGSVPHTTRFAMNCLTAYQTLPWLARPLDLPPTENVWDMIRRPMHLFGNFYDWTRQLE
ncbi:hypothetical protein TNCV_264401 [Trichonephila clavipes]|nr:hypothetical protein TNCV_264401 [Trichonephila clavipes]